MQCRICGKVFTRNQTLPFHRHLATHDTEPETVCSCSNCGTPDEPPDIKPTEKDPLDIGTTSTTTSSGRTTKNSQKKNLLKKMQSHFNTAAEGDNNDDDTDDEQVLKPYECGKCSLKFSTIDSLEKHVAKDHTGKPEKASTKSATKAKSTESPMKTVETIDDVIDEFAKDAESLDIKIKSVTSAASPSKPKAKKFARSQTERNWQECPDRNWAAEFGYGGKSSIGPTKDILSRMALTFKGIGGDEDEDDDDQMPGYDSGVSVDDEDKIFRTRGFKGNVKASLNRAPRTLSTSSLRTRKRMEALMRRAREFMKKDIAKEKQKTKPANKATTRQNATKPRTPTPPLAASIDSNEAEVAKVPDQENDVETPKDTKKKQTIAPRSEEVLTNDQNKNGKESGNVNPFNSDDEISFSNSVPEVSNKEKSPTPEKEVNEKVAEEVMEPENEPEVDLHLQLEESSGDDEGEAVGKSIKPNT